jgi:predicted DNA-binding protein
LLVSQTGKAKGALALGEIIEAYLDETHLTFA